MAATLARRILNGEIPRGARLPAVRQLAEALAVNRGTVQRAYRELEVQGLVTARVGSGTEVTAATAPADGAARPPGFSRGIVELARAVRSPGNTDVDGAIDFAMLLPDVAMFPRRRLTEAVAAALGRGDEVLQYGSPAGLLSLRRLVAKRLSSQGIEADAEEVVIVNGIQQALDLLAKVTIDPGDCVVVESPTYANVLPLLKLYGASTASVAIDTDGLRPDLLAEALGQKHAKLIYTMPSFHNPTGVSMSLERRRAVIDVAARFGTLLVEDACEQDIYFADHALPALASLDAGGRVVHLGTFSKGLFPGLRLGFIVARGELRQMLVLAKRYSDYHADMLSQAVLAEILASGDYERHLEKLRKTYRERMTRALAALGASMPNGVTWNPPGGGFKIWLELPPGVRASTVVEDSRRRGVLVLGGAPFFASAGAGENALRLSISRTDPKRIEEGISTLADVVREAVARGSHGDSRKRNREAPSLV